MARRPQDNLEAAAGMDAMDFMVESIPNEVHPGVAVRGQNPWLGFIGAVLVSVAGGVLCLWAAGVTLGLFLGGLIVVAIITGALVSGEETWLGRGLAWGGAVHGVAGVWLYASIQAEMDLGLWASCYLVLAAMAAAIGGLVVLLRRVGVGPVVAGGVVTLLALAWLTWPVWLSAALGGRGGEQLAAWLVPANPVFAVNAVLREGMGVWAEQPLAYNLSTLSEVAYGLPESVAWCLVWHAVVAGVGVGAGLIGRDQRA